MGGGTKCRLTAPDARIMSHNILQHDPFLTFAWRWRGSQYIRCIKDGGNRRVVFIKSRGGGGEIRGIIWGMVMKYGVEIRDKHPRWKG